MLSNFRFRLGIRMRSLDGVMAVVRLRLAFYGSVKEVQHGIEESGNERVLFFGTGDFNFGGDEGHGILNTH